MKNANIEKAYAAACERYAELGVDVEKAIKKLEKVPVSLHCWQSDDVGGFEKPDATLSGGGIQTTGNYPGKARNIGELKEDLKKAYSLIPGQKRLNLHAIYGEFGGKLVDRDQIEPKHFQGWVDFAKEQNIKLDFNSTLFSHPKADAGYTLSSLDKSIRDFWIEHTQRCRKIAAFMGKELNSTCFHNIWIPDGSKDITVERYAHRAVLKEALDEIFKTEYSKSEMRDTLESKLFGIGSESYVVGSHEFYMGYAFTNKKTLCFDMGHFHPTESIADKISSALLFSDALLLHVSRGVRWDSDHVVIFNDDLQNLMLEIVRMDALDKVAFGLDYFDASINRVGAMVIGARAAQKALLFALLEPLSKLKEYEAKDKGFERLALLEEAKTLPFGDVWNYYCVKAGVAPAEDYINEIAQYEKDVTSKR